jgi:hypothetical protein
MSGCSCVAPKGRNRMGMHSPKQINFLEVRDCRAPSAGAVRLEITRFGLAHQIGMAQICITHDPPCTSRCGHQQNSLPIHSVAPQLNHRTLGSRPSISNRLLRISKHNQLSERR